jgi:hypothetical protein
VKDEEQYQVEELWHNLQRVAGYVTDPAFAERVSLLLRASWQRVNMILPAESLRRLEPPPDRKEVKT